MTVNNFDKMYKKNMNKNIAQKIDQSQVITLYQLIPL